MPLRKKAAKSGSHLPTCSASSFWWPLWKHLHDEHGLILVESECDAIAAAVDESRKAADIGYTCRTTEKHLAAVRKQRDAALKSLAELHSALVRYEADVDGEAPSEHRRMMNRAAAFLPENADLEPPSERKANARKL